MSKLNEFFKNYQEEAARILEEMPELDKEDMLRKPWDSVLLPQDAEKFLLLADTMPEHEEKIVNILAFIAIGNFFSACLKKLADHIESPQNTEKDIIISWFLSSGINSMKNIISSLRLSDIEDLVCLVSCLEYRLVFVNLSENPFAIVDALEEVKLEIRELAA